MNRLVPKLLGREGSLHRQLARGSIYSLLLKIFSIFFSFLVAVVLARLLGPAQFGVYSYVLAIAALLAIPAQCGLAYLVLRETARADAANDLSRMRGVWRWANVGTLLLSLLIVCVGSGVAWMLSEKLTRIELLTFVAGLILVPLLALGDLRGAALRGLSHVIKGQLPEKVLRPAVLVFLIGATCLLFSGMEWDASVAMTLNVLAALIAFLVGAGLFIRARPRGFKSAIPTYDHRGFLASIGPMSVISSAYVLNQYTDLLVLGLFLGADQVGVYRVAMQVALLITFVMQAVNMAITPYYIRLHQSKEIDRLVKLLRICSRVVLVATLPLFLMVMIVGEDILIVLFGASYAGGYHSLIVLALAQFLRAGIGPIVTLLSMIGHERQAMDGILVATGVNIVSNLILVPSVGMIGAAVSVLLSTAVWVVIVRLSIRKIFESHPGA